MIVSSDDEDEIEYEEGDSGDEIEYDEDDDDDGDEEDDESEDDDDNLVDDCVEDSVKSVKEIFVQPETIRKFFPGYGWFIGAVTETRSKDYQKRYCIRYEDGYVENCSKSALKARIKSQNIEVGDIGCRFLREYDGVFYSGTVKEILPNGMRDCYLNDGWYHEYTMEQLVEWENIQNNDKERAHKAGKERNNKH